MCNVSCVITCHESSAYNIVYNIDCPVADVSLLWTVDWFVDRCRTTNNMLGDCYGAAVVETLSRAELRQMDRISAEKDKQEGQDISDKV